MRHISSAAVVAISVLLPFVVCAQSPQYSITNYQYVSQKPVSATMWQFTYKADLVNTGAAQPSVTATLTSLNTNSFTVVPNANSLTFTNVPANSQITSTNTFTILVNRTVPFDNTFSQLSWAFQTAQPPVADAGSNQTVKVGSTVTLNGSGSTNPSNVGTLTYSWSFTSKPPGSTATLMNPTSVMPTFVVDVGGTYVVALTVSNGQATGTASVTVSTGPVQPTANAGPNQTVSAVGTTVQLNGSGSTDPNGNALTYSWTLSGPAGSTAALSATNIVNPTFVTDKIGTYTATLVVNNGFQNSTPSSVTITDQDVAPVAMPTASPQAATVGSPVQLDGSKSTDSDGNPLTYTWSLMTVPSGSKAALSNANIVNPTFTPDVPGTYIVQLTVSDGILSSSATVTVSTNMLLAPTANAGPNQSVTYNSLVQLSGSGTDPQNLPLTYQWSLTTPAGSHATLSSTTIANPTFVADTTGTYVAQLTVSNGTLKSAPSTVMISTTCNIAPTANSGPAQTVVVGSTVTLTGSGSSDACHDTLTYAWSLSVPTGSHATLTNPTSVSPTFVPDVAGMYVAQLIVNNGFQPSSPSTVSITAVSGLAIATSSLPNGIQNTPYTATVTAVNGTGTLTWSATGLPAGLSIAPSTGVISGMSSTAGTTNNIVVTVTDSSTPTQTAMHTFSLTIAPTLSITTPSPLPNGTPGASYTATLAASGGTGTLTWAATGLPANLTINSSTGVISGMPMAAASNISVVVTVTDSGTPTPQTATKTFSLTISNVLSVTTTSLPTGVQNTAYTTTLTSTGGNGAVTWTATGLPAGLSLNSSTGVINGTPTAAATSSVVVTATDQTTPTPETSTKTLSLVIAAPLSITGPASLPNGTVNTAYTTTTIATNGGTAPLTFTVTGLPAGLSINSSTGAISGTPTASVTNAPVVVTVTDSGSPTAQTTTKTYSLNINSALMITGPASLPNGIQNAAYTSTTITATGGMAPLTWSATGLPAGLTINSSTGVISGTPTAALSNGSVVVTVTDSSSPALTATKTYTLNIITPVTITGPASLPSGTVNTAYTTTTITANGGTAPLIFSATGLPAGLSINASTGAISGTPTAALSNGSVVVTVNDSSSPPQVATKTYTLTIVNPLSITGPASLPSGTVNTAYTTTTVTTSGGTTPLTFSATGLPAGLSINSATGVISGTPTATLANGSVVVTVTDSSSPVQTTMKTYSLTIAPPMLSITGPASLPSGMQMTAYGPVTVTATGGTGALTFSATGLPAGVSINSASGVISGTPTAMGPFSVMVTVTDSGTPVQTASKTYSVVIAPPMLLITTVSLPGGTTSAAYTTTLAATGGTGALTWSATGLPAGLSINSSTGVISGTPTTTFSGNVVVTATDSGTPVQTATATLSLVIVQGGPGVTIPAASVGVHLQIPVTITVPTAPSSNLTFTLTSSDPTKLELNGGSAGVVPSLAMVTIQAGQNSVTVTAIGVGVGTANLVATGGANGSGSVTVTPSGFVLLGPNCGVAPCTSGFSLNQGASASFQVQVVQLDNSGNILSTQQPLAIGQSATVTLTSLSPSVGAFCLNSSCSPTDTANFGPGATIVSVPTQESTPTFTAIATGSSSPASTVVSANVPSGYSAPGNNANQVVAMVNPVGCTLPAAGGVGVSVGKNLETRFATDGSDVNVQLSGVVTGAPLPITISSTSGFLLATGPTATPSAQITITVPVGSSRTLDFYVVGPSTGALGTVTNAITANAGSFGMCSTNATLTPSGFVVSASSGSISSMFTTGVSQASQLTVFPASLNSALGFSAFQALSATAGTVTVPLSSSNPSIGTISPSVTFAAGQMTASATFTSMLVQGQTMITAAAPSTPAGFSTVAGTGVTATVQPIGMHICGDLFDPQSVGYHLEVNCAVQLTQQAPAPISVTLTSSNPSLLLLSTDPTGATAGQASITVTVPANMTQSNPYFVQVVGCPTATQPACAAVGGITQQAQYTATASGFGNLTGSITLAPSGVRFANGGGVVFNGQTYIVPFSAPLASGPVLQPVYLYQLDPNSLALNSSEPLAGGLTLMTSVTDDNSAVGTVSTPITFTGGSFQANTTFTPLSVGNTILTVATPPNFGSTGLNQNIEAMVQ